MTQIRHTSSKLPHGSRREPMPQQRSGKGVKVVLSQSLNPPKYTLLETNKEHLKMDGWKTIVSFWGPA